MSLRLIASARPRVHHDALDWARRVAANGGSVSRATLRAVSTFCDAIDRAGIRDRFYRLNLFCGTGLTACLVPLYRGPSFGGTLFGNTTDANNGPFVSTDYVETGATGGLQSNGSTKYLNTGLPMNFTTPRNYHLSAFASNFVANNSGLIGADTLGDGTSPRFLQAFVSFNATPRVNVWYNAGTNFTDANIQFTYQRVLFVGSGNQTGNTLYANGSAVASAAEAGAATNVNTYPIYVFAWNLRNASLSQVSNVRISMYSAGLHMTASQASAYSTAVASFNSAMGRV